MSKRARDSMTYGILAGVVLIPAVLLVRGIRDMLAKRPCQYAVTACPSMFWQDCPVPQKRNGQ